MLRKRVTKVHSYVASERAAKACEVSQVAE